MKNSGILAAVVVVALLYFFRAQISALFSGPTPGKTNAGIGGVGSIPSLNSTFNIPSLFTTGPGFRPGNTFGTPSTDPSQIPIFGATNTSSVSSNTSTVNSDFDPFASGPGI